MTPFATRPVVQQQYAVRARPGDVSRLIDLATPPAASHRPRPGNASPRVSRQCRQSLVPSMSLQAGTHGALNPRHLIYRPQRLTHTITARRTPRTHLTRFTRDPW
ncbi:hypothetical protein MSAN_00095100 [Mycena sanguinolenta]|uniref:Uncharacterized protein n=1 Tax=Mycena sanguinolenta TaxID=230812 RepID=A0A8H6ZD58_9AGAR|nr:hypothetical protein MSAN_00095100 [Mycena sanguinolenta]